MTNKSFKRSRIASFMEDRHLLLGAVIAAGIGTAALLLLSFMLSPEKKDVGELDTLGVDAPVKIVGHVQSIRKAGNNLVLTIEQPSSVDVFLFQNRPSEVSFGKDDLVEVIGKVSEYDGKRQIIANRVRVIS